MNKNKSDKNADKNSDKNSVGRFDGKVDNYQQYRPGYPEELFELLKEFVNPDEHPIVADIGSDTGTFSQPLLENGFTVYAVEPNESMREVAERQLNSYHKFHSVNGSAEKTTLPDRSVNWIVSATAFHWFEPTAAKKEFNRILLPGGIVVLVWNIRLPDFDEFSRAYEVLWKRYGKAERNGIQEEKIIEFFSPADVHIAGFRVTQTFDRTGLLGRSFSSSYSPAQESPEGLDFARRVNNLFDIFNKEGKVNIHYETKVFISKIIMSV